MKYFLQKMLLYYPNQNILGSQNKSIHVPEAGLIHYTTPFPVYQFFMKVGILMLDSMFDAVIISPIRIILSILTNNMISIEFRLDLIQTAMIWLITWLFTFNYFEVGFWYHIIRSQSQIKLYGIIQILDLLDRLACTQGDYIIRQLYWQNVYKNQSVFNRYLPYSFIYIFAHACLLGLQLTVYNVIFSQKVQLLYLALFVLSLIKLKGSVFKKQDEKSCITTAINDGREYFQKALYIILISMSVKFTPVDFYYKIGFYFFIELLVDSFKYISIFHLNSVPINVLNEQTKSLSNFMYAVSIQQDQIKELSLIDQKDLCIVLQNVPLAQAKIIGKFNIVIFPQVIIILKMLAYNYQKHKSSLDKEDYIYIGFIIFIMLSFTKMIIFFYHRNSQLYLHINKLKD
ncbi:unnamed protein product (macronuclear) [Paramecium tetraurelia]|uniref:Transmembrane protein n=1 Tax=Paramecium tetraurelia TaxID=5888 RepID=A0D6Z3_PARTE|nr:uncharacterized protein GSPATT00001851001 [Paramecium tetraurelia]CAK78810.1 unnamed protein product [Paramecium tetraurelia]|eukprot:XP_001446207.1 hypothetical protein (macronuclear) [Paramecium tetraurelia strain d4-2]